MLIIQSDLLSGRSLLKTNRTFRKFNNFLLMLQTQMLLYLHSFKSEEEADDDTV